MAAAEGAKPSRGNAVSEQGYVAPSGQLKQPLTLLDAQGGFVGLSGTIWSIEPDGTWVRKRYVNRPVPGAKDATGRLTPRQLRRLARILAEQDLAGLPPIVGRRQGANPHLVRVTYGTQEVTLELPAARPMPSAPPSGADEQLARFIAIVQAIRELVTQDSAEKAEDAPRGSRTDRDLPDKAP